MSDQRIPERRTVVVIEGDVGSAIMRTLVRNFAGHTPMAVPRRTEVEDLIIPIDMKQFNDCLVPIPAKPKQTRAEWRRAMKGTRR